MKKISSMFMSVYQRVIGEVRWLDRQLKRGDIDKNVYYDRLTELIMKKTLRENSICVDVGCHAGSILQMMMKYSPGGRFYAFEPLPDFFEILQKNFNTDSVKLYRLALSNKKGISDFNYVITNPGYSGLIKRSYDRPEEDKPIKVATDTLDNIIGYEQVEKISFMKIDVEGGEYHVLKGGMEIIRKSRPVIVFEHGWGGINCYGKTPEDVYEILCNKCGLEISLMSEWLLNNPPLGFNGFCDQYYNGKNYYFLAHPL